MDAGLLLRRAAIVQAALNIERCAMAEQQLRTIELAARNVASIYEIEDYVKRRAKVKGKDGARAETIMKVSRRSRLKQDLDARCPAVLAAINEQLAQGVRWHVHTPELITCVCCMPCCKCRVNLTAVLCTVTLPNGNCRQRRSERYGVVVVGHCL